MPKGKGFTQERYLTSFSMKAKVQQKIVLIFVLFCAAATGLVYFHFEQQNQKKYQQLGSDYREELGRAFQNTLSSHAKKSSAILSLIAEVPELQQAMLTNDRLKLLEKSNADFELLKAEHGITHFYFHDKAGTNVLRVHRPERFGDNIERATLDSAMKTGQDTYGIEFGVLGHFVLRVVKPWRYQGEIIGYLELGEELIQIFEELQGVHQFELFMGLNKAYLEEQGHMQNMTLMARISDWSELKEYFVTRRSNPTLLSQVISFLASNPVDKSAIYESSGKHFLIASSPIKDFSEQPAAQLIFSADVSALIAQEEQGLISFMIPFTAIVVIFLLVYSLYSGRIQQDVLKLLQSSEENISLKASLSNIEKKNHTLVEQLEEQLDMLDQSQKRYRTLFDKTTDALLLIDGNKFIDCNQATLDMLGYNTKEELYNTHPSELSPTLQPDGRASGEKANEMIEIAFSRGSHRFEWDHMRKNGEVFPVEVLLTSIPYGDKNLLYTVWRDITERKKAEAEVHFRALYDALTELPNRRLLFTKLEEAYDRAKQIQNYNSVLFIDLDRFKNVNDSMGHSIGDKLLIASSKRIQKLIREDDVLARFGGDEFVILLNDTGEQVKEANHHAETVAETIRKAFLIPIQIGNYELQVTLSIGIATFPIEDESIEDILKHADTAMYSAKENGRNKTEFFVSNMQEDILKRLNIEKDLVPAMYSGQLFLNYQPQVDHSGKMLGVEALARWQHPRYGYISPEEFVHVAEETGHVVELGTFVLRTSCSEIHDLRESSGNDYSLSINVSPRHISHAEFIPSVVSALKHFSLPADCLILEITEHVVIENFATILKKLKELRELGVRISLDDFGTGYSSLSYLKQLPLSEIKIDRTFIMNLETERSDANLIKTIIDIGQQFELDVVAEGVETKEQLAYLVEHQCSIFQGYHFSKPLPISELREYLKLPNPAA